MSPPAHDQVGGSAPDQVATTARERSEISRGTAYGLAAYGIWGLFPLFFATLRPAGPVEILAHRVLWTVVVCLIALAVLGQLRWVRRLLRRPRLVAAVAAAGLLIACNWTIYTFAVLTGHVTEAALGYFLNPLVTVGLGVLVLHETLRVGQWVAVGIGGLAAVYLTFDYGAPPWISLSLALSFASYGLLKKRVGTTLSAWQSLTGESLFVVPFAVAIVVWLGVTGASTFTTEGTGHALLLVACGPATALPLLLFAAAARRVPLVTVGLLQFLTPVLQLLCGVLLLGESLPVSRWVGFGLVWIALLVLSVDSLRAAGRARRLARAARGAVA
ncbi:MAG: EamA family transporter RarD [Actinomycetota bacterium]|nr:EamA family transporter RarD [Actinomycetota bacterium]